jgi:serine/threonine-protein kinase/endoribonuclease IRE1
VEKIGGYYVCFEDRFCIGEGSKETEVFVGLGTDGVEVAIKRVDLECSDFAENEKEILNTPRSVENPNVLNYRFYFESSEHAYIVTDLQEENLNQFVLSEDRSLAKLQNKGPTILRQILSGINALHDEDILHRDLRPKNILVNFEGKMILTGFGICRRLQPGHTAHQSIIRGTIGWMALESLPNDDDSSPLDSEIKVRYMKKSDVQVLGMLFYYILTKGKHPFGKWNFIVLSNISSGESNLTELEDPVAKDLIQWMLQHNITERPTVKQCLKHPYLMSPEDNFKFLTAVGNEMEIKTKDSNSIVVQTLNMEASLATPPWCEKIDGEIYSYFSRHCNRYSDNGAELLRFIRNVAAHWPAQFLDKFDTPQAYFLEVFPTLPMIVHNILRKYPDWCHRDTLRQFF